MDMNMECRSVEEAATELERPIDGFVVDGERIILTRIGEEVAALVHPEDARWLQEVGDRADRAAVAEARAEAAEHGTIPWEQVKAELAAPER